MLAILTLVLIVVVLSSIAARRSRVLSTIMMWLDRLINCGWQILRLRWLMVTALILTLIFFSLAVVWDPYYRNQFTTAGVISFLGSALMLNEWILTTFEASLAKLVRTSTTREYSQAVFVLAVLFGGMALSHVLILGQTSEVIATLLLFSAGLLLAFRSIWATLSETSPTPAEDLPAFSLVILKSLIHHFVTLALLSWGFLIYLNTVVPHTFVIEGNESAPALLLGTYVVGKVTMAGSGLVTPSSGLGIAVDTLFSVLGFGMAVIAVTCFFALLQRVKEGGVSSNGGPQSGQATKRKRR